MKEFATIREFINPTSLLLQYSSAIALMLRRSLSAHKFVRANLPKCLLGAAKRMKPQSILM